MTVRESFLCRIPIAHRGLHEGVPENSRAAFAKAIEEGYAIETDVRRTKDGTLVVVHDDNLKRLTGLEGKVSRSTWRELSALRLENTDEKIMTLEECLEYIDGRAPLLLEVKDLYTVVGFPREVVNVMRQYKGEYALQSFNPFYVHRFKQLAPDVLRGQLAVGIFSPDVLISCRDTLEGFDISPEIFSCEGGLTRRQVKEAVSIPVIGNGDVFTPEDAKRMVEETGCDGIMVARGAKGNPWIFREIAEYLETGRKPPRPSADELKAMILRHGQMMLEFKGETAGMREMRKHVAWYTAGYPNSAALRNDINTVSTMDELTALIGERL